MSDSDNLLDGVMPPGVDSNKDNTIADSFGKAEIKRIRDLTIGNKSLKKVIENFDGNNDLIIQEDFLKNIFTIQNWLSRINFTAIDWRRVAWDAGDILMPNGNTYPITNGNTGIMSSRTYIYWDYENNPTSLSVTTDKLECTGVNKILVATAKPSYANHDRGAIYSVFGGSEEISTELVANSVMANHVGANTIITNQANIGNAIIVDAHINNLNADKITTGTIRAIDYYSHNPTSTNYHPDIHIDTNGNLNFNVVKMGDAETLYCAKISSVVDTGYWLNALIIDGFLGGVGIRALTGSGGTPRANIRFYADNEITVTFDAKNAGATMAWYVEDATQTAVKVMELTNAGDLHILGSLFTNGADFAEYYENLHYKEIPKGKTVTIKDGKVKICEKGEQVWGVVSTKPGVISNSPYINGEKVDKKRHSLISTMGQLPILHDQIIDERWCLLKKGKKYDLYAIK